MKKLGERELSEICRRFLRGNHQFEEAYEIARKNSRGNVWLIGGYIYRNLVRIIYGDGSVHMPPLTDIDFLLEGQTKEPYMPPGWEFKFTSRRDPSFIRKNVKIDLNDITNYYSILVRDLPPTIANYLTGNPLNIQSLAFDIGAKKLIIGKATVEAINNRVLKINNWRMAEEIVEQIGISLEDMLKTKADELGFNYLIPAESNRR